MKEGVDVAESEGLSGGGEGDGGDAGAAEGGEVGSLLEEALAAL